MIVREFYGTLENGIKLFKTYSDSGYKIRQVETGAIYDEAIDGEFSTSTYEETNELIEEVENNDI